MLVNSKVLLKIARANRFAIPAVNYITMDMAKVYVNVAESKELPIILAYAEAHDEYLSLEEAAFIGKFLGERSSVPVVLHYDHGQDLNKIYKAIDLGFTSVMIDASKENLDVNIALTNKVIDYAHKRGVSVEAELGHVGANSNFEAHEEVDSVYTDPNTAKNFIENVDVDSLAVSIGTAHGNYLNSPELDFNVLHSISQVVEIPLVLHGGSSTGVNNLKKSINGGIAKINIFTDFLTEAFEGATLKRNENYLQVLENERRNIERKLNEYYDVFISEDKRKKVRKWYKW